MSFISKYFTYAGTNVRYSLEMNYSPLRQAALSVQVLLLVPVRTYRYVLYSVRYFLYELVILKSK